MPILQVGATEEEEEEEEEEEVTKQICTLMFLLHVF
jgi:hypothetical protein